MQAPPINEDQMEQLLEWIDGIPFSRPKKNLNRDFSDGILVSEIMKQYYPNLVQLHNYAPASALNAKFSNWKTLNQKVFKKLKFQLHSNDIQNVISVVPGTIERVLFLIYGRIKKLQQERSIADFDSSQTKPLINFQSKINSQIYGQLAEKQETIKQLRSTIQILQTKMRRMEQLNRLKDAKIESLIRKLEEGIN